jgi:16S rRNA (adenine1518-N6/adenine1519-N6)-dimethyltransferase
MPSVAWCKQAHRDLRALVSSAAGGKPRLPPARKRLGQHFLHDARVLDAIVDALGPLDGRTVVEIGPGRGALTSRLADRAGRVVAVELDRDLAAGLRVEYALRPHVRIVEADVLDVSLGALAEGPYVLAGNVPYYITTPILFHALDHPRPDIAVYLVQKEVADRMAAAPGSKVYGALSVNLQAFVRVRFMRAVGPRSFNPPPAVESAIVQVMPRETPAIEAEHEAAFRSFVIGAFGLRRKQMVRVVRTLTGLDAVESPALLEHCGIDPMARPETLSCEDFARLVRALAARGHAPEAPATPE